MTDYECDKCEDTCLILYWFETDDGHDESVEVMCPNPIHNHEMHRAYCDEAKDWGY